MAKRISPAKRIIRPKPKTTSRVKVKPKTRPSKRDNAFDAAKKKAGVTGYSASRGFSQAKKEKAISDENRRRGSLPWRLWLKPGSEADVILLDKEPYFMYEHQFKGGDGRPAFERCIKDSGHCPMCSKLNREGYYVMMLTCIDLRGYKTREGKKVRASQKLFPVKQSQIPKYERIFNKNKGSFRGVKLHLARDGDRDAVIGNDIEHVETLTERALAKYGEELTKPVDFEKAFPRMSEKEMASRYNTSKAMGSSDFDEDDDEDEDDSDSWD